MSESVWPSGALPQRDRLRLFCTFVVSSSWLWTVARIIVLGGVYFVGVLVRLPTLSPVAAATEGWWFLDFIDAFFTAGALGRGAFFCLGVIATLAGPATGPQTQARSRTRTVFLHLGLAAAVCAFFVMRGELPLKAGSLIATLVLVNASSFTLGYINKWLADLHGPALIELNVGLVLYLHASQLIVQLGTAQARIDVGLAAVSVALMASTIIWVLRKRAFLPVCNIRSRTEPQTSTLQLRGIDEYLLEFLGVMSLSSFVSISGLVSLLAGWRAITRDNYPVFLAISAGVLLILWRVLPLARRLIAGQDAHQYALQLVNALWIVPGVIAGPETEARVERETSRIFKQSFLLIIVWLVVFSAVQIYVFEWGSRLALFPFGPLVFCFLVLILVGYVSMAWRAVGMAYQHFEHTVRGKFRLLLHTFPIRAPSLDLFPVELEYWQDERFREQIADVMEWYRRMRALEATPGHERERSFGIRIRRLVAALFLGVVLAFGGGAAYVWLVPGVGPADLYQVIIPLFLSGLISPTVIESFLLSRKPEDPD